MSNPELLTLAKEEWRSRFRVALKLLMEDPNLSDEDLSYVLEELGDDISLLMSRRPVVQNKEKRAVAVHPSTIDFDAFDSASSGKTSHAVPTNNDKQKNTKALAANAANAKQATKNQPVTKPTVHSAGSGASKASGTNKPDSSGKSGKAKAGSARTGK